jgi:signal transduction histidine kinase/CheY-like chemotaxis protein
MAKLFQEKDLLVLQDRKSVLLEEEVPGLSGTKHYISNKFPISDLENTLMASAGISTDITDQTLLRGRLEAALESKSEFLAVMSHEIRTPMNGILGMVTLLGDTELSDDQNNMVHTIQSCGDGLLTILNDILDISKVESGKLVIEHSGFELRRSIDEVYNLFMQKIVDKGLAVEFILPEEIPDELIGDITRVKQIISNFLSNAIKFTSEGMISLSVDCLRESESNCDIRFTVKDTGIGFSDNVKEKVFQPFTQADLSTTRKYGGTGLGLSICTTLASLMGGKIDFDSVVGEGSRFSFTLPFQKNIEKPLEVCELIDNSFNKNMANKYPHHLLIVEDNKVNQKLATMMLEKLGYETDVAENGRIALDMIEKKKISSPYTLIFMDLQMPVMDGLSATKEAYRLFAEETPTIVAMTANAFTEDKEKCFEVGMKDFISKPFKVRDFKEMLIKYS